MRHLISFVAVAIASGIAAILWRYIYHQPHHSPTKRFNPFPLLLSVGLLCRVAFLFLTPTFYAPDEQSHYNHVKFIATHGEFAVQTSKLGDASNEWEHNQPPLYYLLLTPFYSFSQWAGLNQTFSVWLMRSFSLLLWALNVWLGIVTLNRLQITDRVTRTFSLGLICLLPTFTFSSSAINNDNLLATIGMCLLCWFSGRNYTLRRATVTGLLLALGLLTKQSAVVFAPLVVGLVGIELLKKRLSLRAAFAYLALSLGLAFAAYLPWAIRNWQVYHTLTPEFFVVDQVKWPSFAYGVASAFHNLVKSFWAVSGIANDINYPFPLVGMLLLVVCLGAGQIGIRRKKSFDPLHRAKNAPMLVAIWLGLAINVALVLRFGYLFGMGQGRHLFPLLLPIALLLGNWLRPLNVPRLAAHIAGGWICYALTFLAYSLTRFPR